MDIRLAMIILGVSYVITGSILIVFRKRIAKWMNKDCN